MPDVQVICSMAGLSAHLLGELSRRGPEIAVTVEIDAGYVLLFGHRALAAGNWTMLCHPVWVVVALPFARGQSQLARHGPAAAAIVRVAAVLFNITRDANAFDAIGIRDLIPSTIVSKVTAHCQRAQSRERSDVMAPWGRKREKKQNETV